MRVNVYHFAGAKVMLFSTPQTSNATNYSAIIPQPTNPPAGCVIPQANQGLDEPPLHPPAYNPPQWIPPFLLFPRQ